MKHYENIDVVTQRNSGVVSLSNIGVDTPAQGDAGVHTPRGTGVHILGDRYIICHG